MVVHQLTKYVGSYAAAMGGVDAITFAVGGVIIATTLMTVLMYCGFGAIFGMV